MFWCLGILVWITDWTDVEDYTDDYWLRIRAIRVIRTIRDSDWMIVWITDWTDVEDYTDENLSTICVIRLLRTRSNGWQRWREWSHAGARISEAVLVPIWNLFFKCLDYCYNQEGKVPLRKINGTTRNTLITYVKNCIDAYCKTLRHENRFANSRASGVSMKSNLI